MVFSRGKAYLKHVATGQVKQIGVRVKNIYKLEKYPTFYAAIPPGVRWGDVEP